MIFDFPNLLQDKLFRSIEPKIMELCVDFYGAWVIQCILKDGRYIDRDRIFAQVWKNPIPVITHRYGSFLVQNMARMYYVI